MAYKFEADEPVRRAIRRCAGEQLDRAILELRERSSADPTGAIHSARKAIKKERSLLRLARGSMSQEQRQHENAALRAAARCLSGQRDMDVMIGAIGELSERFAGKLPAATWQAITVHLEERRSAEHGRSNGRVLEGHAVEELAAVRARLDDWQLRRGGWKGLADGLMRSYTQGRDAFARACGSGETEVLHAWRRRVKDLWYHERLIAPVCGPTVRAHAKELGRLADALGTDHDLALLGCELASNNKDLAVDLDAVQKLIDHRRAQLQTEAARIGTRLYAEKPKAFRRRMRTCWKVGRALARAPRKQQLAR